MRREGVENGEEVEETGSGKMAYDEEHSKIEETFELTNNLSDSA